MLKTVSAFLVVSGVSVLPALAQQATTDLTSSDSVVNTLSNDSAEKSDLLNVDIQNGFDAWKSSVKELTGLDFGFDYNVLGYYATRSLGDDTTASGVFRVYGYWELLWRDTPNNGGLVFKFENRHGFTDVPPTAFGAQIGYVGLPSSVFSDQEWRTTNLYWKQRFANGRGVSYLGFIDVTDFVDVYALASPWTGFSNIAFQTGSGTMGGLPDGSLGAMAGGFLNDNVYAVAGIADLNADQTNIGDGFDTFFNQFETFKSFELGVTSGQELLFLNNAHVTVWHVDESESAANPGGWGMSFSLSGNVENNWLPFLRAGFADGGGSLYEAAVTAGFGYSRQPGQDLLGVGLNWSRPNEDTFGLELRDQWTMEVFQRLQLTEGLAVTPSVQLIANPALNPDDDFTALFGLRARAAF